MSDRGQLDEPLYHQPLVQDDPSSLRSKSVRAVERILILLTVPEMVPMVTVSPIRTGRSKQDDDA